MMAVEGRKAEDGDHEYLFQGISGRPFRRKFNLADYIEVTGASFENGLLQIDLMRKLPEAMKPCRITIHAGVGSDDQQIEHIQAAGSERPGRNPMGQLWGFARGAQPPRGRPLAKSNQLGEM